MPLGAGFKRIKHTIESPAFVDVLHVSVTLPATFMYFIMLLIIFFPFRTDFLLFPRGENILHRFKHCSFMRACGAEKTHHNEIVHISAVSSIEVDPPEIKADQTDVSH